MSDFTPTDANLDAFAANIRRARERKHLSIADAAKLCGVSLAAWYSDEANKEMPNLRRLLAIAARLDTTASKLLRGVI